DDEMRLHSIQQDQERGDRRQRHLHEIRGEQSYYEEGRLEDLHDRGDPGGRSLHRIHRFLDGVGSLGEAAMLKLFLPEQIDEAHGQDHQQHPLAQPLVRLRYGLSEPAHATGENNLNATDQSDADADEDEQFNTDAKKDNAVDCNRPQSRNYREQQPHRFGGAPDIAGHDIYQARGVLAQG